METVIVFDLEWNSGLYTKTRLDEILQIGAVKVSGPRGPILDAFNAYVRPRVHRRFSPAAATLPDLSLSRSSHLDFPAAYARFLSWCGPDRVFCTWGGGDMPVLLQNQAYWNLPGDLPPTFIDLQQAFGHAVGARSDLSLERCAEYCRVPLVFDPHNALYDAVYTWMVARPLPLYLLESALHYSSPSLRKLVSLL